MTSPACRGPGYALFQGDSTALLYSLHAQSVDLVFSDPPYHLSNGGTTCRSGRRASVDKGEWDASEGLLRDLCFHRAWLAACRRVLKPTGTIWVSGTSHAIFAIGFAMQEIGFHLLNTIVWAKPNPPPNLACRYFTHSTEIVIWAAPQLTTPLRHRFDYEAMKRTNGGKQMRDLWEICAPPEREKEHGRHPTQKPVALLERIITASSQPGDLVLDPFCGSGTTGVVAVPMGRQFIGIDLDEGYLGITERRIKAGMPVRATG